MAKEKTTKNTANNGGFNALFNWLRDGNLKSPLPDGVSSFGLPIFLWYFFPSREYFVFINNTFNNYNALQIPSSDILRMWKEIMYYTGYTSFQGKKAAKEDNELIHLLKEKYPYLKKDDVCLLVNIIDNSEDCDTIYEMFGLKTNLKAKKLTSTEKKARKNKIQKLMDSDELLAIL